VPERRDRRFLHERGTDSGCGDNNWPKTFVFLTRWGFGHTRERQSPELDPAMLRSRDRFAADTGR
jgi:hypothetical protein